MRLLVVTLNVVKPVSVTFVLAIMSFLFPEFNLFNFFGDQIIVT